MLGIGYNYLYDKANYYTYMDLFQRVSNVSSSALPNVAGIPENRSVSDLIENPEDRTV